MTGDRSFRRFLQQDGKKVSWLIINNYHQAMLTWGKLEAEPGGDDTCASGADSQGGARGELDGGGVGRCEKGEYYCRFDYL